MPSQINNVHGESTNSMMFGDQQQTTNTQGGTFHTTGPEQRMAGSYSQNPIVAVESSLRSSQDNDQARSMFQVPMNQETQGNVESSPEASPERHYMAP